MATKGPSNLYGNTRGSRHQGEPTEHIKYAWAKEFTRGGLNRHFNKHKNEFNYSKDEYAAKAVKFANAVDRDNYKSVVDYKNTTYKYCPKSNELVEVTKDGYIVSYRHYGSSFWYEPKKGEKVWIKD